MVGNTCQEGKKNSSCKNTLYLDIPLNMQGNILKYIGSFHGVYSQYYFSS